MTDIPTRLASALAERYRVEREIGAGGMATVYLAEDLRHGRKVALKVLREEISGSVGAGRFLREIAIAAQLQHPNILPLHDSGEAGGLLYYVMPFVEGQSLRERLDREGELPIGEVVRLLSEIVDALAYAHARGVVHRDMKPDNVMLSARHALVSDFGVAKALSDAAGGAAVTTTGLALGTPAYMAPEQATGDPHVDHRADIYAVGVMAYELLTGVRPFGGNAPQQVLAAHALAAPVPVSQHRAAVPAALERAVMRCLEKRPADRWQRSEELLAELESLATPPATAPAPRVASVTRRPRLVFLLAGSALLVLLALGALWMWRDAAPGLSLGRAAQLTTEPGLEISPALSPDGRVVAYAAGTSARMRIFLEPIAGGRTLALSDDTTTVESQPSWSRDGDRVLFLSRGGVYTASSLGGTLRQVVPGQADAPVLAAAWSPDGREIAVVRSDSVLVYSAEGAPLRFVVRGRELNSCEWSPLGTWLACVSGNNRYVQPGAFFANLGPSRIVLIAMADGRTVAVTDSTSFNQHPQWSGDGSQLYFISNRDGTRDIYVATVRADGRPRGEPLRLTTGLTVHSFSVDAQGRRLAYALYQERANLWSLPVPERPPVSAAGAVQLTSGSEIVEIMRVYGEWVYYDSDLNGNSDIYRIPLAGGTPERLTTHPASDFAPALFPDGSEFAFHSFRGGSRDVFVQRIADGSVRQLTHSDRQECCPSWAPDGRALTISEFGSVGSVSILRRDSAGNWSRPELLLPRGFLQVWSPDASLLAVSSGRTIRGALQSERLELLSLESGATRTLYEVRDTLNDPSIGDQTWGPDGKGLYFKSHDAAGRASLWYIALGGGRPRLLVRFDDPERPSYRINFGTDGKHFVFAINDRQSDIWVAEASRK